MKKYFVLIFIFSILLTFAGCGSDEVDEKPVIYLYPSRVQEISVYLDYDGTLTTTYPEYDKTFGWEVTAYPDGTLIDKNGQEYNYLYWEGNSKRKCDFSKGFCVAGKDTAKFLEDALDKLGLTRREANEFIVYWLPQMQTNPYNLISFQSDAYTNLAELKINPQPDSVIRVFMAWKPLEQAKAIPEQQLNTPTRAGFTVVEWGGRKVG